MKTMDFASLLNDKMKKAAAVTRGPENTAPPAPGEAVVKAETPVETLKPQPVENPEPSPVSPPSAPRGGFKKAGPVQERGGRSANTNRVTVNLFDADRRALAVIKEHLANAGHDFTNRSDSIKIGLRLAAKAKKEELAQLLQEIRAEDRRFSND